MLHHMAGSKVAVAAPSAGRRVTATAFASVALGTTAMYAALTVAPLAAEDLTGSAAWSGLPNAALIVGTAAGAAGLSALMARHGRRPGLIGGWVVGAAGGGLAVAALVAGLLWLLVVAMTVVGVGHGASQLARYAAADAQPEGRRGGVLSLVVWAATIGAVAGPSLLGPAAEVATTAGLPGLAGGYVATVAAFATAAGVCWALLRPDPGVTRQAAATGAGEPQPSWDRRTLVAVGALVAAQFVMVLVMTVTPVHVRGHDHGLAAVGVVMSAHLVGMFGLAPAAGWVVDRVGGLWVAAAGLLVVAVAGVSAAAAPTATTGGLAVALFLLGLGWSAAFVASSTLLARASAARQGRADALGWLCAAVASVGSGVLVAGIGYPALSVLGAVVAVAAAVAVLREAARDRAVTAGRQEAVAPPV